MRTKIVAMPPPLDKKTQRKLLKLVDACKSGDIKTVSKILKVCPKLADQKTPLGNPVIFLVLNKNWDIAQLLFDTGANVNSFTKLGVTCLSSACTSGPLQTISELLKRGAKVNKSDIHGWTPIMHAAYKKRPDVVNLLLKAPGINVNKASTLLHHGLSRGSTVAHCAIAGTDLETIKLLLKSPLVDWSVANENGELPKPSLAHDSTAEPLIEKLFQEFNVDPPPPPVRSSKKKLSSSTKPSLNVFKSRKMSIGSIGSAGPNAAQDRKIITAGRKFDSDSDSEDESSTSRSGSASSYAHKTSKSRKKRLKRFDSSSSDDDTADNNAISTRRSQIFSSKFDSNSDEDISSHLSAQSDISDSDSESEQKASTRSSKSIGKNTSKGSIPNLVDLTSSAQPVRSSNIRPPQSPLSARKRGNSNLNNSFGASPRSSSNSQANKLSKTIQQQKSTIASLEADINRYKTQISILEKKLAQSDNADQLAALIRQNQNIQTRNSLLEDKNSQLEKENVKLKARAKDMSSLIETLISGYNKLSSS